MMKRWGFLVWTAWLLIAVGGGFVLFESLAFQGEGGLTLSRFVFNANKAWPLVGPLMGFGVGILFCHFFWHWDPAAQEKIVELNIKLGNAEEKIRDLETRTMVADNIAKLHPRDPRVG